MVAYIVITLILTIIYVVIFLCYLWGWLTLPEFKNETATQLKTSVSIIVPVRNEEANIRNLLNDLLAQSYPHALYEIIIVDDFSSDNTSEIVRSFDDKRIKLISLHSEDEWKPTIAGYKKQALRAGIEQASGELLVTTDGDCSMNQRWLDTIASFYESEQCRMILAPVLFNSEKSFFANLQSLDFIGLMGITGATLHLNFPTMCNGSNLAFSKKAFDEVQGYDGIDHIASGDDMLLLQKFLSRWNGSVKFLRNIDAVVHTPSQRTLKSFLSQRLRWTSKSKHYMDKKIIVNLAMVYLYNLSLLVTLILSFVDKQYLLLFLFQVALKVIVEFAFLSQVAKYFNCQRLLSLFLPAQLFHVLYIVIVGAVGNFYKPVWKGRKIT